VIGDRGEVNEKQQTGELSRREWLTKIGLLLNGLAVTVLAMPIIGYLVSPLIGADKGQYKRWITLGDLSEFPENQTRLATLITSLAGYAGCRVRTSRSSR